MTEAASRASRELSLAGIIARYGEGNDYRGTTITAAMLKQGAPLLADVIVEDDQVRPEPELPDVLLPVGFLERAARR